jgi:4-hydroxybenzoate polyprenyltransferase
MLLFYIAITTAYSMLLKKIAILDIVILAGLFTTRLLAGGLATAVTVSEWLLAFSMFIFLSLAAIKRYVEVRGLESQPDETQVKGRGYIGGDAPLVLQMGLTSGFMAVLVLALFISSESVTQLYHRPKILWLVCPLMLYWVGRIWLLARRGRVEEDPLSFAAKDWMTWLVALCGAVILLVSRGG